ncbi:MAG: type II toxin-antitoxin system VapC family toxin [Polyangiales bacterium]
MIVIDASALVELLMQSAAGARLARRMETERLTLHAPDLILLEVMQVLRKASARGLLREERAQAAVGALLATRLQRYAHAPLAERIWSLRGNLTAYDAAYVALAESLEAPLVTLDARIAAASGHRARVEVIERTRR